MNNLPIFHLKAQKFRFSAVNVEIRKPQVNWNILENLLRINKFLLNFFKDLFWIDSFLNILISVDIFWNTLCFFFFLEIVIYVCFVNMNKRDENIFQLWFVRIKIEDFCLEFEGHSMAPCGDEIHGWRFQEIRFFVKWFWGKVDKKMLVNKALKNSQSSIDSAIKSSFVY